MNFEHKHIQNYNSIIYLFFVFTGRFKFYSIDLIGLETLLFLDSLHVVE